MVARVIAIDGPAGAGKSTIAKIVANCLGYIYIDTGAMYRAIALLAIKSNIALDDHASLTALAKSAEITLKNENNRLRIYCNGEDVSEAIRISEVGNAASEISTILGVRQALVERQRKLAKGGSVVLDGRDIGSVVLPDADCKIFLTASIEERCRRRVAELQKKGFDVNAREIAEQIRERDYRDSHRQHSPLMQAANAILIDSSDLEIAQVVEKVLAIANLR